MDETILHPSIIETIDDRCKVCYTCVRDCPAKAIKIIGGQAQIMPERCIACGNCVRVCRQKAKRYKNSLPEVLEILKSSSEKVAIVAPSFPSEFHDTNSSHLVGMLRKCGFTKVCQVAYGADLVAKAYKKLLNENNNSSFIATSCPAIVFYVEKYRSEKIQSLAPICSPMIASARDAKKRFGKNAKVIFIGPCIAKKVEALRYPESVDAVLTYEELRQLFKDSLENISSSQPNDDFDPPHPKLGMLFPMSRGLLQAADIVEDLLSQNIVATDGKNNFVSAIDEFAKGEFEPRLLELLCCKGGCINGPGTNNDISQQKKRKLISNYAVHQMKNIQAEIADENYVDVSAIYYADDVRTPKPSESQLKEILERMGKILLEDELDCGACGYTSCRDHARAIFYGLAESEMCLPYVIKRLKKSLDDLSVSNSQLEKTKQALINAEKLASMGQLSAGIAHEINNPLGVILLNSSLILESIPKGSENHDDIKLIVEQAEQCKKIVSGLLNFARKNKVLFQRVNVPEFISERCLKPIIYKDKISIEFEKYSGDPFAEIDPDQMMQVMTNMIVNAMEAMPNGGKILVSFNGNSNEIKIGIKDEGTGIAKEHINKIFEPFFTTKQMGKGTGLGLAVTYGIIKMHRGRIEISSNNDPSKNPTGTQFTIVIPRKVKQY
jgi:signal transduction histidine kinase/Fe-S-cluster-containing hydrogenase component 2